ncbi:MAG: hypothetical protein KBA75_04975 [Alphaproteobacteria bacterium]|nr:hypothetical protein [Alphaproteobacteria bacterium]
MTEAIPHYVRWTELVSRAVREVFMYQSCWWTLGVFGLLSGLFEVGMTQAVTVLGTLAAVVVLILATLLSWAAYFFYNAFWLYVLSYNYPKFDMGHFLLSVRKLIKPYAWMVVISSAIMIVLLAGVVVLLFGYGLRSRSDYLQAFPLVILCMCVVLSTSVWMRLSFSCVSFMNGDTAALKVAWRRTKNYWWDMTMAAIVFGIPCIALEIFLKWAGVLQISSALQEVLTSTADASCASLFIAIQVHVYTAAKTANLPMSAPVESF